MSSLKRLAVIGSGTGTTAQSIVEACQSGDLAADVALIVGNNSRSGIIAGYLKKIGPEVLAERRGRMINTHPALLPAYGSTGMYGDRMHAAVLADGAQETGATVHLMTKNYDEGPVLDQQRVPVRAGDDVASLRERVQVAEKELLLRWLKQWAAPVERAWRCPS